MPGQPAADRECGTHPWINIGQGMRGLSTANDGPRPRRPPLNGVASPMQWLGRGVRQAGRTASTTAGSSAPRASGSRRRCEPTASPIMRSSLSRLCSARPRKKHAEAATISAGGARCAGPTAARGRGRWRGAWRRGPWHTLRACGRAGEVADQRQERRDAEADHDDARDRSGWPVDAPIDQESGEDERERRDQQPAQRDPRHQSTRCARSACRARDPSDRCGPLALLRKLEESSGFFFRRDVGSIRFVRVVDLMRPVCLGSTAARLSGSISCLVVGAGIAWITEEGPVA